MKIKYEKGDVFASPYKFIMHGCNSKGVMGAGFALQVKKEYPYAYEEYRRIFETRKMGLGEIQIVKCRDRSIINAITQNNYGRAKIRYASYDAIALAMATLEETLYGATVAMPKIGAGLAGGDWNVIEAIIESELKTVQPVVFTLD